MNGMFSKPRIPVGRILTEGALPSRAQRALYRRRGYRIADDVTFAPGVVIEGEEVEIGAGSSFGFGTVIRGRRIRIGRRVDIGSACIFEGGDILIGDDTVVREQVFVGGPLLPDSLLELGKRVRIFQTCFLNPSRPLRIGDDTGLGGRSSIFTHGSWQSILDGYPVVFEPVTIGKNVWLPWHVFILPGVELGDNATIGAGSVVNRSIPAGALAAGVPAKVLKSPEEWPRPIDEEERWRLARAIVEQFGAYLRHRGVEAVLTEDEHRVAIRFERDGRNRSIELIRAGDGATGGDIVLQLTGRPERGRSWFALGERIKGGESDEVSTETDQFLSRYGLRFVPFDEL